VVKPFPVEIVQVPDCPLLQWWTVPLAVLTLHPFVLLRAPSLMLLSRHPDVAWPHMSDQCLPLDLDEPAPRKGC